MVRLAQLVLAIALLTGVAQAADKIALACVTTNFFRHDDPPRDMSLIVDLGRQTVTTIYGVFSITRLTDTVVWFDDGSHKLSGWSGNIDRISGVGRMWHGADTQFDLTCKPATPLF